MSERRPITMKDVALKAGVSSMTVSAVLSGTQSSRVGVSDATRARVLDTARQMRYRPNAAARILRGRSTNVIGFYTSQGYLNGRSTFFAELIAGLQEGCDVHQKDLLLHGAFHGHSPDDIYGELMDGRVDGLVLMVASDDPLVALLSEATRPVVAIVDPVPSLTSIVVDDAGGTTRLVEYLVQQGHRHVHYRTSHRARTSAARRLHAFRAAAVRCGLTMSESRSNYFSDIITETDVDWLMLPKNERPTAVVCWNDATAFNLLSHCNNCNISVPDEIAIIGFDGVDLMSGARLRLTTMRAPWTQVAATAVSVLIQRLRGEEVPLETTLPVTFIQGETA